MSNLTSASINSITAPKADICGVNYRTKDAAVAINKLLPSDPARWVTFLKRNRKSSNPVGHANAIPFSHHTGHVTYADADIAKLVVTTDPEFLTKGPLFGNRIIPPASEWEAGIVLDMSTLNRFVVSLFHPRVKEELGYMSPDEALTLAAQLTQAARRCKESSFDPNTGEVLPTPPVPQTVCAGPSDPCHHDSELDDLLVRLDRKAA